MLLYTLWLTCAYLQVSGHRIRLHFDKYSDCYDFWVNSNSPDIHPVGWCEKTGHKLHPPKGKKHQTFTEHPKFNSSRQILVLVVKLYLVSSLSWEYARGPCGFCVSVGMKDEEFSWSSYIKLHKIQTAPKALFQNQNMVRESITWPQMKP